MVAHTLLLRDGAYDVVARIEAGGQKIAEINRQVYAISNFSDSIAQMSNTIASIKKSSDTKVKAIASLIATPEFQLQRLSQLIRPEAKSSSTPNQEIDRIEAELSALAKGQNPLGANAVKSNARIKRRTASSFRIGCMCRKLRGRECDAAGCDVARRARRRALLF